MPSLYGILRLANSNTNAEMILESIWRAGIINAILITETIGDSPRCSVSLQLSSSVCMLGPGEQTLTRIFLTHRPAFLACDDLPSSRPSVTRSEALLGFIFYTVYIYLSRKDVSSLVCIASILVDRRCRVSRSRPMQHCLKSQI